MEYLMNYVDGCFKCETAKKSIDDSMCEEARHTIHGQVYVMDVTKVLSEMVDRRVRGGRAVKLPHMLVEQYVRCWDTPLTDPHIDHVDLRQPGILITLHSGIFLADGHHRAARSLKLRKPFYAWLLDSGETTRLLKPNYPYRIGR